MHLLLVQAERAWAHAMHIKSSHAEDNASKGISGPTRKHIISRLHKAVGHARHLVSLLADRSATKASDQDHLEAEAYALYLAGSEAFEQQVSKIFENAEAQKEAWSACLTRFSEAHVIYSSLLFSTQKDVYREVIGGNIDPSIRYAAYQSKLPRTIAVSTVAKRHFRRDQQKDVLAAVQKLNPNALSEDSSQKVSTDKGVSNVPIPTTITWRKRSAPIADAAIGQSLAATALAASNLSESFSSHIGAAPNSRSNKPQKLAAAYDPVLTSAQDTVDAVRRSIADLTKEGVTESDSRMQDLRVSDLAVNYSLVSWRIGRNRVLIGGASADDGATFEAEADPLQRSKAKKSENRQNAMDIDHDEKALKPKAESVPRAISRLTTRVVLLDSTIQSIDSLSQLPGATRDTAFQSELTAQRAYFQALRCINIAYSHTVIARNANISEKRKAHKNALALFDKAKDLLEDLDAHDVEVRCTDTPGLLAEAAEGDAAPPTLVISSTSLSTLQKHLDISLIRQRGLCILHQQVADDIAAAGRNVATSRPLVEHMNTFPPGGQVDLKNIVTYPPRLEPVPVKPIFLDLAWNYIDYPGRHDMGDDDAQNVVVKAAGKVAEAVTGMGSKEEPQKKKGWFGFGR